LGPANYQPYDPRDIFDCDARIFGVSGDMLGERLLLCLLRPRLGLGLVGAFMDIARCSWRTLPFSRRLSTKLIASA
jgi:hypothetical protein